MAIAWILNPPGRGAGRKTKRKKKNSRRKTSTWQKLVKKYGVKEAAKKYKKKKTRKTATNKRKTRKKGKSSATGKRRKNMARMTKAKRRAAALKGWRKRRRKTASNKPKRKKRKSRKNPKGTPKTAKGKAWRRMVKKYGVQKAAKIKRARKRGGKKRSRKKTSRKRSYAANKSRKTRSKKRRTRKNAWKGGTKTDRRISALMGHARRKGISPARYLREKGISAKQLASYRKRHGLVGAHRRYSTKKHRPSKRQRYFAANPMSVSTLKKYGKAVFSADTVKDMVTFSAGMLGAVFGQVIAQKVANRDSVYVNAAGNVGGAFLTGFGIAAWTKKMDKGILATMGGLSFTLFNAIYSKFLSDRTIPWVNLTLPAIPGKTAMVATAGDYVELPAGMSDYVELPAGVGDYVELPAGMNQFIPGEELGQFTPAEELGQQYDLGGDYDYDLEY